MARRAWEDGLRGLLPRAPGLRCGECFAPGPRSRAVAGQWKAKSMSDNIAADCTRCGQPVHEHQSHIMLVPVGRGRTFFHAGVSRHAEGTWRTVTCVLRRTAASHRKAAQHTSEAPRPDAVDPACCHFMERVVRRRGGSAWPAVRALREAGAAELALVEPCSWSLRPSWQPLRSVPRATDKALIRPAGTDRGRMCVLTGSVRSSFLITS